MDQKGRETMKNSRQTEIERRLEERLKEAHTQLDIFYADHGEWDGRRKPPVRKRGILRFPDQENDQDPENTPSTPEEIPEDGMSIIEAPPDEDKPARPYRPPEKPVKAPKKPGKASKPKGRPKSSAKTKPKKKPFFKGTIAFMKKRK
jgi:hypothetical protein